MSDDFSSIFHESSKDLGGGGSVRIPRDIEQWPEEWLTVEYKTYPRFPVIELPQASFEADLCNVITTRTSGRDFSRGPISLSDMSAILKYSCGVSESEGGRALHRAHPSGGGRYPIEVYPIVLKGGEIPQGVYHYNIKKHGLDTLWQREFSKEDIAKLFTYEWAQKASVAFVLTSVFARTQVKYGERGYRYILIEAGHIGQNVCLTSHARGLDCCPIVGTYDKRIEELLDIDGVTESVVYTLMLG